MSLDSPIVDRILFTSMQIAIYFLFLFFLLVFDLHVVLCARGECKAKFKIQTSHSLLY